MYGTLEPIIREAGALAAKYFDRLSVLTVESKGHLDLVSEADRAVEKLIGERLRAAFPGDGIFGEEGVAEPSRTGRAWIVDPIDGTFNFLRGSDHWAVSIGLRDGTQPRFGAVFVPKRDQLMIGGAGQGVRLNGKKLPRRAGLDRAKAACSVGFHPSIPTVEQTEALRFLLDEARMTFRNTGSAVTGLIDVATDAVDGYLGLGISTWDLMAMVPILAELGVGTTLDWNKIALDDKLRFACGTPEFLDIFAPLSGRW
jgi:myo-inositol-1(or 4)-monophosphatase